ncbi:DNA polymerase III subunit gamma/tau [uncultured Adlercreutzia sp.]|uniref:DNA polymerase III subunit gamma/tau n=1 Tax=uncultured Adlercreutzia sp. TaxID=875803 RepID=UPI0025F2A7F1|nr:DNA polymerase III subunit gamma/tau [uncultured Adlercreutzia sp.]
MAEALYRKYRPQIFEDVVGQEHIERTIKNAIAQDKVSHAYLFTGPRGTGKTTTARLLAKALLCESGPTAEPDGTCEDCELIAAGEHPDVYELDAASRTGVENVREEIIGRVQFAPTRGRYKVYIIDEVHMLSTAAFNALLKTLEEPPSHVVFILATTDPQKVPETIHSRCQRFDFRRISTEAMVSRLGAICVAEGVEFEGEALDLIAHRAEGGLRNALTSLEQLIAFGDGTVSMEVAERMLGSVESTDLAEIVRAVGERDAASCFRWVAEYVETGADMAQFVGDLATHMRNMYVMAVAGPEVVLEVSDATRDELARELPLFGADRLARLLGVLGDVAADLKTSTNPRLSFEIALTRMVRPESDVTMEALAERVESLERQLAGAAVVAPAAPVAPPMVATPPAPAAPVASPTMATPPAPAAPVQPQAAASAAPAPAPAPAAAAQPSPAAAEPASPAPVPAAASTPEAPAAPAVSSAPAPAPSPEPAAPAPAAPAAAGPLSAEVAATLSNVASLQRLWAGALATLKKAKAAYGVLFMNTKAVFDAASGTLVVEFPAENDFAFRAVQKADVQAELAEALRREARADIPFELRKAGASGAVRAVAPAAPAPTAVPAPAPAPGPSASAPVAAPAAVSPAASVAPATSASAVPAAPASVAPAAPTPAAAAPDDDRPPYDDYVPYGDDDIPFEAPAPAAPAAPAEVPPWEASAPSAPSAPAASSPAPAVAASAPAPAPTAPAAPAPAPAPSSAGLPPEPDAVSGPSPNPSEDPDDDALAASLAFGFGEGVTFEQVL